MSIRSASDGDRRKAGIWKYAVMRGVRYAATLLCLLTLGVGEAWAGGGTHYISATTADPAQGLVYLSKSNQASVPNSSFKNYQPGGSMLGSSSYADDSNRNGCYIEGNEEGCTPSTEYYWARPARGYVFSGNWGPRPIATSGANIGLGYTAHPSSTTGGCNTADELNLGPWTGVADGIQSSAGGSSATWQRPIAYFSPATKYVITYAIPAGGSYSVHYGYINTYDTGIEETGGNHIWRFKNDGFDFTMTTATEEARVEDSYAADTIILSVPSSSTSFLGWYEGETKISESKTYTYTAHANVTISPLFKEIGWGDVTGDLTVNVGTGSEAELTTYGDKKIYVACPTLIGPWTTADFTVTTTALSNSNGSIALGSATLDVTNNRLEIPYSFTATHWGGIDVTVTVTPAYGEAKQFTIACSSEEVVGYEACIEESGVRTYTGTLAAMMTQANTMTNKPTVKLMNNNVVITTPVSITKSMTFDVNGKVLTANCTSAFSIDAAGIDVQIMDGSFTQVGEIHTAYASSSAVSVVTFTKAAKLTMNGGTLSAANTGAGAAYGVDVQQGSIFFLTNGDLTVSAGTGSAQGVHVASASDYATLNGGSIAVSAPTNAYGLWSAGQSNITDAKITVETTTGANAYGVYVNGGISTITTTDFAVNAKTTNAYGAYVNAGRLNFNGGKLAVEAVTSDVYGVYIAAGATAMMQQNTKVTAEATGASGTKVYGINNLGTVSLNNLSVTATSPTNYATAVNSEKSAVSTTIEDGTYTANAETGYAYGLHHQYGSLNVDGGTFKGIVKTSGTGAYGARAAVNATIANATILGEAKGSAGTAYGFVGGVANKTITLTNCDITGKSNTNKAYAIYSRTGVTATGCTLTATTLGTDQAYGLYAEDGTNALVNCNATVTAQTVKAYGVNHVAGSVTIKGGSYTVDAKQGAATGAQNSELYGLYNAASKTTSVTNATFTVIASNAAYSQNVYGACINGILNSTGASYTAQAKLNVFGIWGNTASTLNLSNNTVSATATNGTKSYGVYAKKNFTIDGDKVSAVATTTDVFALYFDATSVGEVRGGKFKAAGNGTTTYGPLNAAASASNVKLKGGVYDANTNLATYKAAGYNVYTIDDTEADYAAGYYYVIATENPSPYVCKIVGGAHYTTLEAAMQYTKDNAGTNYTIVMTQNYTLPAGDYELPSNATLLIPHIVGQNAIYGTGADNSNKTTTSKDIVEFMRLTLAANAKLSVSGKIEVSAQMWCAETGHISYIKGPYARIYMNSGSLIQLNSGAVLYAWGKVTGSGEITVKSNAEVREMFQIYGMPSMSNIVNVYNDNNYKFFPVQQYEINNIEVPTTYYYNSRLVCGMSNYYKGVVGIGYNKDDNIKVIGTSGALFLVDDPSESSWVRKSYASSYQVWEVNSSAKLGSLKIVMEEATMNSANYILPITTNMKIHVLDGEFAVTQSTQFLPGSQLEINKTGKLTINSGCSLYVFDADQSPFNTKPDALVNVHGKIDVKGSLFTTKSIANGTNATNGANIYSNNADAGTITFNAAAASASNIQLITGVSSGNATTRQVDVEPAKLKNGDASYTATAGTASGEAFAYLNGAWTKTYTNGCFEVIGSTVYAKPSEYVALKKSQTDANSKLTGVEETNHTYLTADDKILILMDGCQWWEVEATADPTVFECKKAGYEGFYFYNTSTDKWELKTVDVTFYMKETGTDATDKVVTTSYNGIPDQAVIATNPTKETTAAATYQFYGWKSSVTGTEYHWTATLETATADMSYRPVFTENARHYTVTFADANNGASVPVEYAYGETPSYAAVKEPTAQYTYYFQYWLAADETTQYAAGAELPAVTAATTYTAVWSKTVNKYAVVWKNGEEILETDSKQEYGAAVSYDGATPTKDADNAFAYTFDGWSLTDGGEKLASLPTVNGAMTFYAHYSTTPRYAVTFVNYDGTQLQKESVTQGVNPVYNGLTPGRARDLDGYYRFTGWKNSVGTNYAADATLPAVMGKETFTAQYDYVNELYLITLNNVDGEGATWSGKFGVGATPFYNRDNNDVAVEPAKASTAQYEYTFSGWSPALEPVDGEATYTAQFEQHTRKYEITFANLDGNGTHQTIEVEYGTMPVSPVTPEKATATHTYAFLGWDNALASVSGDATYTATFSATGTPRTFPITFDPDNGVDAPVVVNVAYGETPVYSGATPTKAGDAANTYTFSGWSPSIAAVTGEATYTAQYTPTIRTFSVTFKDYDGTVLKTAVLTYGATPSASAPERATDEVNRKIYTFSGWSPAISTVTADATYTATYSEITYVASVTTSASVTTYYSAFGTAFSAANNSAGSTIKLYADVTATAVNSGNVTKNMTIDLNGYTISCTTNSPSTTRVFYINGAYTLTINDSKGSGHDGMISFTGSGNAKYFLIDVYNTSAVATINGGIIQMNYTGNSSYYGSVVRLYNTNSRLNLYGGELIATATNGKGYAIEHDTNAKYGYVYIYGGKLKAQTDIILNINTNYKNRNTISGGYYSSQPGTAGSDITIATGYGLFAVRDDDPAKAEGYNYKVAPGYTVTWLNEDDSQIDQTFEEAGYVPVHADAEKTANAQYTYAFSGWTPALTAVTAATTYKATFTQTENKYMVAVAAGANGTVSPASVSGIGCETASADITATPDAGYTFSGWTLPDGVTAATGYTAASNPIRIHAVAASKTITANFVARNDINYTVKHWQQNIADDDYTEVTADQETKQGTTATATAAEAKDYTGFAAQPILQETIAGDGTTVVSVYYNRNTFAVTWNWNESGTPTIYSDDIKYGAAPVYTYAAPTKPSDATYNYTFTGWSDGTNTYAVGAALPAVTAAITYTAQFEETPLEFVVDDERPVNVTTDVTSTTVTTTGDLEVTEGNTLTTTDLVLEASLVDDEEASGEIRGGGDVIPTGNVYFDLTLNTWARHWRAFGVPWKIANLKTTKLVEIKTKNGTPCYNELVLGRDYDIVYYNGATRAKQGPGRHCWDYVEDGDGTLDPGKAYLIGFIRPTGTVRFTKAVGAPIRRSNETLEVPYYEGNDVGSDAGWNAIANPKTYHASMNAEVEWCHVHNGDTMRSDGFTTKQMSEVKFVVGTAVFVQANPDKSVVEITRQHHSPSAPAPRRAAAREDAPKYHAVHIMSNNKSADRIYIKADEDKEADTYTNGIDVAKLGISTVRAQIWVERYNTQLAVNTMAPVNNTVSYPLGISVPQAGEYEIRVPEETSDMIYLTYDDCVIWNLSYAPYTADLEKGTNSHYGIRMVVSRTPAVATGFDEALVDAQGETKKVLIEDKVYIIRGENVYSVDGQLVK